MEKHEKLIEDVVEKVEDVKEDVMEVTINVQEKVKADAQHVLAETRDFVEDLGNEFTDVKDIVVGTIKDKVGTYTDDEVMGLEGRLQVAKANKQVPKKLLATTGAAIVGLFGLRALLKKRK
ncbi:MAG: hypothetical protein GX760_05320 [Erysipelothrix sp.]|nr:hypothetical protein [Erysipelothrix sp.]